MIMAVPVHCYPVIYFYHQHQYVTFCSLSPPLPVFTDYLAPPQLQSNAQMTPSAPPQVIQSAGHQKNPRLIPHAIKQFISDVVHKPELAALRSNGQGEMNRLITNSMEKLLRENENKLLGPLQKNCDGLSKLLKGNGDGFSRLLKGNVKGGLRLSQENGDGRKLSRENINLFGYDTFASHKHNDKPRRVTRYEKLEMQRMIVDSALKLVRDAGDEPGKENIAPLDYNALVECKNKDATWVERVICSCRW